MILVAGATGLLGSEICRRLIARGQTVRGLVRKASNPDRLQSLRDAGVTLAVGDLKDQESIRLACDGVVAVITTASSTLSRQEGDSIETVDRMGNSALVAMAKECGVRHFTMVSLPRSPVRESPLTRAKEAVEQALIASGIPYTILASNYFMEVWLSPALGFDYAAGKVVIFGDGRKPLSWVSYRDVAELAARAHENEQAHGRVLEVGGPQDLSPLDVVTLFEKVTLRRFDCQYVPEEALLAQMESATDPLAKTFLKLQLEYVNGCLMNSLETLRIMPIQRKTIREYAEEVTET